MWLYLIELGFIGFVLSLFGVIWRGFKADGTKQAALIYWVGAAAFFFALWIFALPRYPVPFPR